ncbi:MAG: hypothetical protein ACLQDY_22335 [Streptosporangiaceae bacterium]
MGPLFTTKTGKRMGQPETAGQTPAPRPRAYLTDTLVKDREPGHPARVSQSELVCLAVAQPLPGFHSEHRWIRFAICHLRGCFP